MLKKILLVGLIILLSGGYIYAMSSSKTIQSPDIKMGYQTLEGSIYLEGTDTINDLILQTEAGASYVISGDLKNKLNDLRGLKLILTGRVEEFPGTLYQGIFEVYLYNLVSKSDSNGETSLLGTLVAGENNLVLLTKGQKVIQLDPETYHSLGEHVGKEAVINGSLSEVKQYQAQMKVKSYKIIE